MGIAAAARLVAVSCGFVLGSGGAALHAQEEPAHAMTGRFPTFHIGLFGNVDLIAVPPETENAGFRNGALDLFATSQLSQRWSGLVELVFENLGGELITDLERYQLSFEHSDALRLTVGRLHNPLVRWNVTQHHGLFLQTPIDKPALSEWEDVPGLWPVHFVGLTANGRFANALGLTYLLGVGNGRGPILDEIQVVADLNEHKAIVLGAGIVRAGGGRHAATLRRHRPRPVLDEEPTGIAMGASAYLRKPVDRDRLLRMVRRVRRPHGAGRILVVEHDRLRELARGLDRLSPDVERQAASLRTRMRHPSRHVWIDAR